MAKLYLIATALILMSVVLVDFGAQARHCEPACRSDERCVPADPRLRSYYNNICVARRCLHLPRRGRCFNHQQYHFDRSTMSCKWMHMGVCYSGGNHFTTLENCQLSCTQYTFRR